MKPFSSREQLFEYYETSTKKQWDDYIYSLTTSPSYIKNELYHISTQDDVAGVWSPRESTKEDNSKTAHPIYGEMLPARISVAETIEGCWAGMFSHLTNNESKIKEFVVYLYKAEPLNSCKVLTPKTLSDYYLVQDAHLTGEYCLIGDVRMVLVSKLTLKNTFNYPDSKWINGHPYNEPRYGRTNYPPVEILKNEPITKESNMSVDNQIEAINELSTLGIQASDLSGQPQTVKGITKKLYKLSKTLESLNETQPVEASPIDLEVNKIKQSAPEWVFLDGAVGDGREASADEVNKAGLVLDELEAFINSSSTEALIDIHATLIQSLSISTEHNYKFHKLEDYRTSLRNTGLVSKDTHRNLCVLGIGMESSLPDVRFFTDTPSMVNYSAMDAALENKQTVLTSILKTLTSLGIGVLLAVAINMTLRFVSYLINVVSKKISDWTKKDKVIRSGKKTVTQVQYKRVEAQATKTASKASAVFKHAKEQTKSVAQISLEGLYRDTANGRLKESELDDLYAAASSTNIKDMKSLWQTMNNVLAAIDKSLLDTTEALKTMAPTQTVDDPSIDSETLKESLITVNRVEQSFKKYEDPKVDTAAGLNIIREISTMFEKGDVDKFEKALLSTKKRLADLDKQVTHKKDTGEFTDELRLFFIKRVYLLKSATEYLSSNIKLQTRFQRLAINHAKLFSDTLESIDAFEKEMENNKMDEDTSGDTALA